MIFVSNFSNFNENINIFFIRINQKISSAREEPWFSRLQRNKYLKDPEHSHNIIPIKDELLTTFQFPWVF